MSSYDFDIGIIGGGSAGLTVAAGCSQIGMKVLLLEKAQELGGDCLHYGCVPSKTLIATARAYHQARNLSRFGLPDANPGPVDFSKVAERIHQVISRILKHDSVERFCGLGVRVEFGDPHFVDDHEVEMGSKRFSAEKWVISTGSSPGSAPIEGLGEGLEAVDHLTNIDLFSLAELPASLLILGGGAIAVEMAQAFARLGSKVTLIQRSGRLLTKEDADMAELVRQALEASGVTVRVGCQARRVEDSPGGKTVHAVDEGGREVSFTGEQLLVALGRNPNVGGLKLENAGVDHDRKGIATDARMRTSRKHIYAGGDVTGKYLFTHAAGYEGSVIVTNAGFHLPRKVDYTNFPWCTYTDPELASIGLNEQRAKEQGVEHTVWTEPFAMNDRALAEAESEGRVKLLLDGSGKPLGVQIFGAHAGELISEWVAVMYGKVKLTSLAGAVHPYPTMAEINKRVAGNYLAEKVFSDKVKKTLSFFFNFKGRACRVPGE